MSLLVDAYRSVSAKSNFTCIRMHKGFWIFGWSIIGQSRCIYWIVYIEYPPVSPTQNSFKLCWWPQIKTEPLYTSHNAEQIAMPLRNFHSYPPQSPNVYFQAGIHGPTRRARKWPRATWNDPSWPKNHPVLTLNLVHRWFQLFRSWFLFFDNISQNIDFLILKNRKIIQFNRSFQINAKSKSGRSCFKMAVHIGRWRASKNERSLRQKAITLKGEIDDNRGQNHFRINI